MRILVTGASGFLGAQLARLLVAAGHNVIAGCRRPKAAWRLGDLDLVPQPLDVTDETSVRTLFAASQPETVIHCAASGVAWNRQDPAQLYAVNVEGTERVLRALAVGGGRFVQVGSCFEYGHADHDLRESDPLRPKSVYGVSKAAASRLALCLGEYLGVATLVVRPFGLWGEREDADRLAPAVVLASVQRKPLELTPGEQVRDYTHVEDAARIIVRLATCADFAAGKVFNLASGQPQSLADFARRLARVLGGVDLLHFGARPYRKGEMMRLVADVDRLRALKVLPPLDSALFARRVHALAKELARRNTADKE